MILNKNLTKMLTLILSVIPYSFQTLLAATYRSLETITRDQIRDIKKIRLSSINISQTLQEALEKNNIDTLGQLSLFFNEQLQLSENKRRQKNYISSFLKELFETKNLSLENKDNLENLDEAAFLSLYEKCIPQIPQREQSLHQHNLNQYQQVLEQSRSTDFDVFSQYYDELISIEISGINLVDIAYFGDLDELDLPFTVYDGLRKSHRFSISELCETHENFIFITGVEKTKALESIKNALSKKGLSLKPQLGYELIELITSKRILNLLIDQKIYTISQLISYTDRGLLEIPDLGRAYLNIIKAALQKKGLALKAEKEI